MNQLPEPIDDLKSATVHHASARPELALSDIRQDIARIAHRFNQLRAYVEQHKALPVDAEQP